MRCITALIVAVTAALALPSSAVARVRLADRSYVQHHLVKDWRTSDGQHISSARCHGDWNHAHAWQYGEWFFHDFKCRDVDGLNRIFSAAVTIGAWSGRDRLHVVETGCSDTNSQSLCPSTTPTPTPNPTRTPTPNPTPTGCYPIASTGSCYEPGEFCPTADYGMTGVVGDGEPIVCEDNNGLRWGPY
jgi:hypothetical protein